MKTSASLAVLATVACSVLAAPLDAASPVIAARVPIPSPTDIPSASSAKSQLSGLTVAASGSKDGYSREKFPHWHDRIKQYGECDTREVCLQRDGTDVMQSSSCAATAGTWVSPYDGATWTKSSDVDIDHMVPLENAWISGASSWTTAQRQAYANDLERPQLWTVTDNVNESKGDRSPDVWKPPLQSFYCTYAEAWVAVKSYYNLTATSAEVSALSDMLDTC